MNLEMARSFFLWCTVINYGVLLLWSLLFMGAHDWFYRVSSKWYRLSSVETFDLFHLAGIGLYKIGVILFNLVPFIALHMIR